MTLPPVDKLVAEPFHAGNEVRAISDEIGTKRNTDVLKSDKRSAVVNRYPVQEHVPGLLRQGVEHLRQLDRGRALPFPIRHDDDAVASRKVSAVRHANDRLIHADTAAHRQH